MRMALDAVGCPHMEQEHKFDNRTGDGLPREWRLDLAHLDTKVCLEIDGGEHAKGHQGKRRAEDYEKRNEATRQGWRVFQLTGQQVQRDCMVWARMLKEYIEWKLDTRI